MQHRLRDRDQRRIFAYNLGLPGQVFDGQAGLHQNGFRDFDPAVGRYVESDPAGLAAGINTHAYVGDSPLGGWDPLGLLRSEQQRRSESVWMGTKMQSQARMT